MRQAAEAAKEQQLLHQQAIAKMEITLTAAQNNAQGLNNAAAALQAQLTAAQAAATKQAAEHREEVCDLKLLRDEAYKAVHKAEQRALEVNSPLVLFQNSC